MVKYQRRQIGRYELFGAIASGGMATVHFARQKGPIGFSRTVAIKRLHRRLAGDPEVFAMLVDEARLAGRIQHPNVLGILDVVRESQELFLVMDYIQGESLARLMRSCAEDKVHVPVPIAATIMSGVLHGLHAAHETRSETGEQLEIVHRDVSPQNIIVGTDGVPRVLDFGIAKARQRLQRSTLSGQVKGKAAYLSPEQMSGGVIDRRTDIWAASIVFWEALTGRRLFGSANLVEVFEKITTGAIAPPSTFSTDIPHTLDEIVLKGLQRKPDKRWATAREMARAIEQAIGPARQHEVSDFVEAMAGEALAKRGEQVLEIERIAAGEPSTDGEHESNAAVAIPVKLNAPSTEPEAQPATAEPAPKKRGSMWLGVAALVLISAGVVALSFPSRTPPAAAGKLPPDAAMVLKEATPKTTGEASSPDPSAADVAVPSASAVPPMAAITPPPGGPSKGGPPPPTVEPPPAASTAPSVDPCRPPYVYERVDDKLIKKWKPECL